MKMNITPMIDNIAPEWVGFLIDWDRTLRAANYPPTTRYNYILAAVQLARFLVPSAAWA